MRKLKAVIKQLFCKHEYEEFRIHGFLDVDGWLIQPVQLRCKKCGKEMDK